MLNGKTKNSNKDTFWKFCLITFLFSWGLWLPGLLVTYNIVESNEFLSTLNNYLMFIGGIGPSLAAFILVIIYKGKEGGKVLFKRLFQFRLGNWYYIVFLIAPVSVIVAHLINMILFNASFPQKPILSEPWFIPALFFVFFVAQMGEEYGWRGYGLDRLQSKYNPLLSSLIIGCVWAFWHLPMFFSKGFPQFVNNLSFEHFFITMLLLSVIITWIQNNTGGSLLPAFILHTYMNILNEIIPLFNKVETGSHDYTVWNITNLLLLLFVVGLIVLCKNEMLQNRIKSNSDT